MNRLWLLGIFLGFTAFAAKPPADGEELLMIAAHRSLLDELFQQPIAQSQPISQEVQGTFMQGTALTSGNVTAAPYYSQDGIGMSVFFQSTTNAYTLNTNVPRPDIQINFDWTIFTQAFTQKNVLLRESGFALYPAATNAQSAITVNGLQAQADGLFWRLKERIATNRAWEQLEQTKAQNEAQAAQSIAQQLNQTIDQRAWDQLLPYHYQYQKYVYTPLVQNGLLGGRLNLGSNDRWMAVVGSNGPTQRPLDVTTLSGLDEATAATAPIQMHLNAALLERLASERAGGLQITEIELAAAMGRLPAQPDTVEGVLGNPREELLMTFDEERPFIVTFEKNKLHLVLHVQELTTLGTTLKNVAFTRDIQIENDPVKGPSLESHLGALPTHYDGSAIREPLAKYIGGRFAAYLPQGKVYLSDSAQNLFPSTKPIRVTSLNADADKLSVGLAPVHGN